MALTEAAYRPPSAAQGHFSDFGDLGRLGGWDLDFRQLDAGPQSIPASVVSSSRVLVMRMRFNRGFHQRGNPPPGMLTFGLPVQGMTDWFGRSFNQKSIVPFNYASGVDGVSRPGFEAFTLSIAEDFLQEVSETFQIPVPDYLCVPKAGTYVPNSQPVEHLRRDLRCLTEDPQARLCEERETSLVVELLTAALANSRVDDKSTPAARAYAVSETLDYLESHKHEAISVGQVCTAARVSWRTLNRAFLERFGIGPKAYLQRSRLAGVRAELLTGSVDTVIADVANNWGFWHMGQFARDYRVLFGELPSGTLQRSLQRSAVGRTKKRTNVSVDPL